MVYSAPEPEVEPDLDVAAEGETVVTDGLDASQVIVDRDELRELRRSEVAQKIAGEAKGDEAWPSIKAKKGGSDHVHRVNPYDLHFEPDSNPREFGTKDMRQRVVEIARSIASLGVLQALDVYVKDGRMFVNGGETRWRATLHVINFLDIAVERVPVIVSHGINDLDRTVNKYIGNDQYRFKPLESGKLFVRAVAMGAEPREIARRIGRSEGYVRSRMKMQEMPEWLKLNVAEGKISADNAFAAIWQESGENDDKAKTLLEQAIAISEESGSGHVMPRHTTKSNLREQLAAILKPLDREVLEQAIGADPTEKLFSLAKL